MLFERTMTEEDVDKAIVDRAKDMGTKLNMLFFARIASICGTVITMISYYSMLVAGMKNVTPDNSLVVGIVSAVVGILYGSVVLKMGEYYDELKTAGICYIVSAILVGLSHVTEITLLVIPAAILLLVYIVKFAEAMEQSLYGIDSKVSSCWNTLLFVYKAIFVMMAVVFFMSFIPWAFIWTVRLVLLMILGIIGCAVFELVILKLTANSMNKYWRSKTAKKRKHTAQEA